MSAGCVRVRGRVARLADGGLAPLDEARDRGHLEACAACARVLAEHELDLELLRAALRGDAGADVARVAGAVRARLAAARAPAPSSGVARLRRLVAGAAAAAALLVVLCVREGGDARAPRVAELARPEPVVAELPGWSDVLEGLARLARRIA